MADVNVVVKIVVLPTTGSVDVTEDGFGDVQAAIAFASYARPQGIASSAAAISVGVWDRIEGRHCTHTSSDNFVATSLTARGFSTDRFIALMPGSPAITVDYTVAATTDGITITQVSGGTSVERMATIMMFSGADVQSHLGYVNAGSAAGTVSVTDIPFEANTILFGCAGRANTALSTHAIGSFGIVNQQDNTIVNRCIFWGDANGYATTNCYTMLSHLYCTGQYHINQLDWGGTVSDINRRGFDLDVNDAGGSDLSWYLALNLGNHNVRVVDYELSTSTGTANVTGVGFRPQQLLNFTCVNPSLETNYSYLSTALGMSDGTAEGSVYIHGQDNVATSNCGSYASGVFLAMRGINYPSSSGELVTATIDSFNKDGFDMNYTKTHTASYNAVALAFGQSKKVVEVGSYNYLVVNKL